MNRSILTLRAEVVSHRYDGSMSLLAIASYFRRNFPTIDQFLFESAGGPPIDTQQSFLGIQSIVSVERRGNNFSIKGHRALVDIVEHSLSPERFNLAERISTTAMIRAIEDCIHVIWPNGSIGRLPLLSVIGYDAVAYKIMPSLAENRSPEIVIIVPSTLITLDHYANSWSIVTLIGSDLDASDINIAEIVQHAIEDDSRPEQVISLAPMLPVSHTVSAPEYIDRAAVCMEHILSGDIYQVQLGHEVFVKSNEDPLVIYERLKKVNPSPYMFLVYAPSVILVGASPELFLRINKKMISMRPLAGTLAKNANNMRVSLASDPKEQAEHIMLVDLCRNDIGRVAHLGSVRVPHLLEVEEFPSVFHLVSTVVGRLRAGLDVWDAFEACSPAGTMTGAPKIRASEIIAEQEWTRRGLYAGSIGISNGRGNLVSALIIRTLVISEGIISVRASAGIVSDSILEKEWLETLSKIQSSLIAATSERL